MLRLAGALPPLPPPEQATVGERMAYAYRVAIVGAWDVLRTLSDPSEVDDILGHYVARWIGDGCAPLPSPANVAACRAWVEALAQKVNAERRQLAESEAALSPEDRAVYDAEVEEDRRAEARLVY